MPSFKLFIPILTLAGLLLLAACGQTAPTGAPIATPALNPTPLPGTTQTPLPPTPTPTPLLPSPTPPPMAARVNNEGITLEEYNGELQRLQAGLKETGKEMSADVQQQTVLDELTNQVLLAQAAYKSGYLLSESDFQVRLDALIAKNGGPQSFTDWLTRNFYTEAGLRAALSRSIAAAWQRDQLIAKTPTTADQVHARQILVLNEDLANSLYSQLQSGANFATLSLKVDPDSGGELGWFPRGYLFLPEIENAAFSLEPGKYSPVIKTTYGYHIVYLIERDAKHPLSPDAILQAQRSLIAAWLKEQRAQSRVEILVN